MKIMHFVHGLSTGGAETLVKNYMLNFDRKKNELVVLCNRHFLDSPYEMILANNGIRMIFAEDFLPFKANNRFFRLINHYAKFFVFRRIIRRESPDVLHAHLMVNRFMKFARPSKRTTIFYTVHTEPERLWLKDKKTRKDFDALKWLIKHYDVNLVVLHDKMRKEIKELLGVDSIILNNGVDIDKFRNPKSTKKMRVELNIPKDAFVMGHVGRFSYVKNHEFLVDVFKELNIPNKFLLMVGDGAEKNRIDKKMSDLGFDGKYLILSNRDDIPDLLSAMDVFVFPSFREGMPISLIEAQEARLPCFVSDKVLESATISNLVVRKSLNDGVEEWVRTISDYRKPKKVLVNDSDWDIRKITADLESKYLNCRQGLKK